MSDFNKKLLEFKEIALILEGLIIKFPINKREEIVFDKWSLKNVVSHLNHWMKHDIDCLEATTKGVVPYWEPDVEEFNRKGVEARKNNSWEEVYSEFAKLKTELIELYGSISPELQNKKIWLDSNHTPIRFLEDDIKHWRDEHIKGLNNFYKK